MTWKTLESAIALASNIAKDYLKYKTSDTKEKKELENDIEQNPENYNNTVFTEEANDGNKEFNNETFTDLEKNIKENPEDFVNSESDAIAKEATDLLDDDKRNDEISEDMYDKIRKENEDWANQLREKYNSQYQSEAPEDLFEGLTEDDVEWVSQMLDNFMNNNKSKEEIDPDWLEQTQANDAYSMGQEENNYLPPEQFKQVGAFLGGKPSDIEDVDYTVEDVPNEESNNEQSQEQPNEEQPNEEQSNEDISNEESNNEQSQEQPNEEPTNEEPINEEQPQEEDETTKRRNNFLDKFRRSISVNPTNGSFTAKENKLEQNKGGTVGKGIGSNINGQSGGVGVSAALDKSNDKKEIEMKEYKEQRNVDKELHYDDVPIEQQSSVNNPGANNGNTGDDKSIKVPNAHSSFGVRSNKIKGKTGHAYGTNKVKLNKIKDGNDLEKALLALDDYSMFEPLIIENIDNQILVDGNPLNMVGNETLSYIIKVLNS